MAKEVFSPLGMNSATISRSEYKGPVPFGHLRGPEGLETTRKAPVVAKLFAPAGGVVLPVRNFARFALAQVDAQRGGGAFLGDQVLDVLPALPPAEAAAVEGEVFLEGRRDHHRTPRHLARGRVRRGGLLQPGDKDGTCIAPPMP
ncbi:MAG: hypothetical protein HY823_06080 [Acidobacteria bacterium]|nr:hypothetical protein [Acidobacteriota bacterium]